MEPVAAFTIALGKKSREQAEVARATFKAFHPEIPFFIVDERLYMRFTRQESVFGPGELMSARAFIGGFLARFYRRVLYLDADTITFGRAERLLDIEAPLIVTRDVHFTYGFGEPEINAGVLAATEPRFWRAWMEEIYSQLIPMTVNFLDQLALRELCGRNAVPFTWVPEREEKVCYNLLYRDEPGEWREQGGVLYKGDVAVKVFHHASGPRETHWSALAPAMARLTEINLERVAAFIDPEPEKTVLHAYLDTAGEAWWDSMRAFFAAVPTRIREDVEMTRADQNGLFVSEAPASLERYRMVPEGLHRRDFSPQAVVLYARERERLYASDLPGPLPGA